MLYINLIAFFMAIGFLVCYVLLRKCSIKGSFFNKEIKSEQKAIIWFLLILGIGFIIRFICSISYSGHPDILCFSSWSKKIYQKGFMNFYGKDTSCDYPPGYIYILYLIAFIRNLFSIEDTSNAYYFLLKIPAIIADAITATGIYILAKKKFNMKATLICVGMYFLNPIVIFNSSVWGQVDSVFSIGIIAMCYLIYIDKTEWSYLAYFLALIIKPQAIMFTPIIMFAAAEKIFIERKADKFKLKFDKNAFLRHLGFFMGSICVWLLLMLPFGLIKILKQYTQTVSSYEFASVNAYNFWAMLGLNWTSQDNLLLGLSYASWGVVVIVAIVCIAFLMWICRGSIKERYFMCAAFICAAMFTMSVRMHERYIYPTIILLIFLFAINKKVKAFWFYVAFSIVHFYNEAHVLFFYAPKDYDRRQPEVILISFASCVVFGFFVVYCNRAYIKEIVGKNNEMDNDKVIDYIETDDESENGIKEELKESKETKESEDIKENEEETKESKDLKENEEETKESEDIKESEEEIKENKEESKEIKESIVETKEKSIIKEVSLKKKKNKANPIRKTKVFAKFTRKDWIIMGLITLIYAFVAFYNLGDKDAPQTFYNSSDDEKQIIVKFDKPTDIKKISFYNGYNECGKYSLFRDVLKDNGNSSEWKQLKNSSYADDNGQYHKEVYEMHSVFCWESWDIDEDYVNEMCIISNNENFSIGEMVFIDKYDKVIKPSNMEDVNKKLFDEQDKLPEVFSYKNSTYFDEIYHARSGYEFVHGIKCYEWTHPPLGKIFISLGIRIFGMCPFGWRFFGTLFGILMLPAIYIFAKRVFSKTFYASIACLLMTFDFMHFAQTRIATIDVFVTFFIILMYYFMYRYSVTSFYDTKLSKTFIPLILCGIVTGCGIASKWTGAYAAAGLGVIFFVTMHKRRVEYNYALKDPDGQTKGIKHEYIIKNFKPYYFKTILLCVGVFIVVPCIIYTLSYIPFVASENAPQDLIGRMIYNQLAMFKYHSNVVFEHNYSSSWYEWPFMIRPILYYSDTLKDGMKVGISAFGNPLIWWLGIPAFVYVVNRAIARKDRIAIFFGIGYLAQLLPWVLVKRLTFIYHYFPSVPFVIMMIVYSIYNLTKERKEGKKNDIRIMAIAYIYAVGILFALFYPVISGASVSEDFVRFWLRWLPTWVFVN